jgi:hypothetical protein
MDVYNMYAHRQRMGRRRRRTGCTPIISVKFVFYLCLFDCFLIDWNFGFVFCFHFQKVKKKDKIKQMKLKWGIITLTNKQMKK